MKSFICLSLGLLFVFVRGFSQSQNKNKLQDISDSLLIQTENGKYLFTTSDQIIVETKQSFSGAHAHTLIEKKSPYSEALISFEYERRDFFNWWQMFLEGVTKKELMSWNTKPKESGYILYPLFWSSDPDVLYLYSQNGDAIENNQGVFEYNIETQETTLLLDGGSYVDLPLINKERTKMFFISYNNTSETTVSELDLLTKEIKQFIQLESIQSIQWLLKKEAQQFQMETCPIDQDQPPLHSPFQPGTTFCVTRMGFESVLLCEEACEYHGDICSPLPYCEGHCELGCVDCRDAVDMDVLDNSQTIIIASASGFVIRAQTNCPAQGMGEGYGFGLHVVIRHGDNNDELAPETLYAHLESVFVDEGDYVFLGQPIGLLGNSQALDCNGDGVLDCDCDNQSNTHIHYEYHEGSSYLYQDFDIMMPVFEDVGSCVVQPNDSYTAGYEEMLNEYTNPSTQYSYSIEGECGEVPIITFIGETCGCCTSSWNVLGSTFGEDTVTFPVLLEMFQEWGGNEYLVLSRTVQSPCAQLVSYVDVVIPASQFFGDCVFGCVQEYACNYNPDATNDDGSCDFSCSISCDDADINNDAIVNIFDIIPFLDLIGTSGEPFMTGDLNGDGEVSGIDLLFIFNYFGQICP